MKVNVLDIFTGHERRDRHERALGFLFTKMDTAALIMGDVAMKTIDRNILSTPGLEPFPADFRGTLDGHIESHTQVEQRAKAAMADLVEMDGAAAIGKAVIDPNDKVVLDNDDFFRFLENADDDLDLARRMGVEVTPHEGGRVAVSAAVDQAIPQQIAPIEPPYPAAPSQSEYGLIG